MAAGEGRRRHSEQPNTDKNVTPTAKAPPTSFQVWHHTAHIHTYVHQNTLKNIHTQNTVAVFPTHTHKTHTLIHSQHILFLPCSLPPSQGADSLPALPPARERPRKATRSYSSQRKQLHQSRTRVTDSNAAAKTGRSCDPSCDSHVIPATPTAEILRRNLSQPMVGGMEGERGGHEERVHSESGSTGHSISPVLQVHTVHVHTTTAVCVCSL